jgi:cysteine desulfurase
MMMCAMPIYLDCAATLPVDARVRAAMLPYLGEEFGNAGSRTHDRGRRSRTAVERARDQVASAIGCGRGDVVFTSGATESNNLAILGLAAAAGRRTHIVSTAIEHHAVLEPIAALGRRGFDVTLIPPDAGGAVAAAAVLAAVRPETLLVSVMHVNNETGVVQPVYEIADGLQRVEAYFHIDAAQGFGRRPQDLRHPRIDLISLSGHKIHGPQGIGALIARRRNGVRPPLQPLMYGGGQERGLRPGTMPLAQVVGLGVAAELVVSEGSARADRCAAFRTALLDGLVSLGPVVNGDPSRTVPDIVNLSFPGLEAEVVIDAWQDRVAVSNGAACTSQSYSCSHVLGAMRLPPWRTEGAVRLSWCANTPEPDWEALVAAVEPLRARKAAAT